MTVALEIWPHGGNRVGLVRDSDSREANEQHWGDSAKAWALVGQVFQVSGPVAAVLDALPEIAQAAIREAAIAEAQDHLTDSGAVVFPAMIVGAKARRPA